MKLVGRLAFSSRDHPLLVVERTTNFQSSEQDSIEGDDNVIYHEPTVTPVLGALRVRSERKYFCCEFLHGMRMRLAASQPVRTKIAKLPVKKTDAIHLAPNIAEPGGGRTKTNFPLDKYPRALRHRALLEGCVKKRRIASQVVS